MTKRIQKYEIREAVRGSFVGASGRVDYDLEAGIVSEKDVNPEALARLMAAGYAVDPSAPESAACAVVGYTELLPSLQTYEPVPAARPAESEEPA